MLLAISAMFSGSQAAKTALHVEWRTVPVYFHGSVGVGARSVVSETARLIDTCLRKSQRTGGTTNSCMPQERQGGFCWIAPRSFSEVYVFLFLCAMYAHLLVMCIFFVFTAYTDLSYSNA